MVFYSFRVMVAIGVFLFALMLLALWFWKKGKLTAGEILRHPKFLYLWIFSIPMGFIAAEAGWVVREIGRQPWILYHMMRTSEGVSVGLNAIVVGAVLAAVVLLYLILLGLLAYFIRKTMLTGPDLESPVV
jgi:cytochrome d ubiquinol oxidase subunit I